MPGQPTQSRYPWRATIRTAFQVTVALASLLPVIAVLGGVDTEAGVVQVIGVCTVITRVMASPKVDDFLRRFVPWLAAEPREKVVPDA